MRLRTYTALDDGQLHTIEVFAPIVFFTSVLVGTVFYTFINGWNIDISYYYATQVLLGNMYGVPNEPTDISQIFTLFYFVWGTSLLAAAIGAMANQLISKTIKNVSEEHRAAMEYMKMREYGLPFSKDENDEDDIEDIVLKRRQKPTFLTELHLHWTTFLLSIGWYDHRMRYIAGISAISWYFLGIGYGLFFEQWDFGHSSFCALSAMAANGLCPPICEDHVEDKSSCQIGTLRALLHGHYILVGVPLFAFTMAQFVGILIESIVRASEVKLLMRPLTEAEFKYAKELRGQHTIAPTTTNTTSTNGIGTGTGTGTSTNSEDEMIDLGGFIVMELLRLRKIDMCDLELIKTIFEELDENKQGVINFANLQQHAFVDYGSTMKNNTTTDNILNHHDDHHSITSSENAEGANSYNNIMMPILSRVQYHADDLLNRKFGLFSILQRTSSQSLNSHSTSNSDGGDNRMPEINQSFSHHQHSHRNKDNDGESTTSRSGLNLFRSIAKQIIHVQKRLSFSKDTSTSTASASSNNDNILPTVVSEKTRLISK